jgi:hypothetical protein
MKDEQRQTPDAERVKDLEVREDEARDVAGGKRKEAFKGKGRRAGSHVDRKRFFGQET